VAGVDLYEQTALADTHYCSFNRKVAEIIPKWRRLYAHKNTSPILPILTQKQAKFTAG